ncbi:MAG: hypothetical protein ACTSU2_16850 [Promethearchaeota archaeon]
MSLLLCDKCHKLWVYFGSRQKPNICPECQEKIRLESMRASNLEQHGDVENNRPLYFHKKVFNLFP